MTGWQLKDESYAELYKRNNVCLPKTFNETQRVLTALYFKIYEKMYKLYSIISEWFMKLWNWKSTARTELYKLLEMDEKLKLRLLSKQSNIGAAYWKMLTSCLITVSE